MRRSIGQGFGPAPSLKDKGAIFSFQVRNPALVAEGLRSEGRSVADPVQVRALVDTGATVSAIENSVALKLGLVRTGTISLVGIGGMTGVVEQPVYAAAVDFPGLGISSQDPVRLAGADIGSRDFEFLLGRDVLEPLVFEYDGPASAFSLNEAAGGGFSRGPAPGLLPLAGYGAAALGLLWALGILKF